MEYDIVERPAYPAVEVTLAAGEQIVADPGAMLSRSAAVAVETSVGGDGGLSSAVGRAVSDEREVIEVTFRATADGATVTLVPVRPGDVTALSVSGVGPLTVQSASLLAWEPLVERSTAVNDAGNFFSTGELTALAVGGRGTAFLAAAGALRERAVAPGDPLVVDEDHLVAWTDGLSVARRRDGSLKTTVLGGEGAVTEFSGEGTVWLQTRNPVAVGPGRSGGAGGQDGVTFSL